jgi:hypothetical protein
MPGALDGFKRLLGRSASGDELFRRKSDILGDPPDKGRADVMAGMHRDGGHPTVGVTELLVRAALPDFAKAECFQEADDFSRLEGRDTPHGQAT